VTNAFHVRIELDAGGYEAPVWREEAVRYLRGLAAQIEAAGLDAVQARVDWDDEARVERPGPAAGGLSAAQLAAGWTVWRSPVGVYHVIPPPGAGTCATCGQGRHEAAVTPEEVMGRLDAGADPELRKLVDKRAGEWGCSRLEALARLLGGAIEQTRRIGYPPYIRIGDVEVGR
jgi:hypothetical protein